MSGATKGRSPTKPGRNRSATPKKVKRGADSDVSKSPGTARKRVNQKKDSASEKGSPVKGRSSSRKKNTNKMGVQSSEKGDIEMGNFAGVRQVKSPMKKTSMKKLPNGVSGEEVEELIKPGKGKKVGASRGLEGEWFNIGLLMVL
jgi:hypothetical protein